MTKKERAKIARDTYREPKGRICGECAWTFPKDPYCPNSCYFLNAMVNEYGTCELWEAEECES